jgi:hypothetical protein
MSDVKGAKEHVEKFSSQMKYYLVGIWIFTLVLLFDVVLHVSEFSSGEIISLLLLLSVIPLIVSILVRNHQLQLVLDLSLELLRYIDENYKDVEIPMDGKIKPLGEHHEIWKDGIEVR